MTASMASISQLYLFIQTKDACPLSITKRTNNVILLLCTLRVLAWMDKCKSSFDLFKAAEVIFFPFGIIIKKTLKNIIQPRITPTERKANRAP